MGSGTYSGYGHQERMVHHPYWEEGNELQNRVVMKVFFDSEWFESIEQLPVEVQREVCLAVIKYSITGTQPELKPMGAGVFLFIKKEIDKSKDVSASRSAAGKKGAEKRRKESICYSKPIANYSKPIANDSKTIANDSKPMAKNGKNSDGLNIDINLNTSKLNNNLSLKEKKEEIIKKEITKKESLKKKDPREEFVENLPDDWRGVVSTWLRYKAARKEYYKTVQTLQVFYKNLREYSSNNVSVAQKVIEQSIGNNWKGIFPLRNQSYSSTPKSTFVSLPTDYEADSKIGFQV